MKFLTFVWLPFWLFLLLGIVGGGFTSRDVSLSGGTDFILFALGGLAMCVTIVYAITRIFRRATQDANRRY